MPIPSFVTVVQLVFAVAIILALQAAHLVPKDPLEWAKVKVRYGGRTDPCFFGSQVKSTRHGLHT